MKKKIIILNISLILTVLFSLLFQSVHSYEHFLDQEHSLAVHSDDPNAKEIKILDHNHEKCFVCEFTLGSFIATEFTCFTSQLRQVPLSKLYLNEQETPVLFCGSLYAHRGPPSIG